MSEDLDVRIRVLMRHVVDEAPAPPDVPTQPPLPARRRWPVPGWAVAVGVAAAILVIVGAVGLLVRTESAPVTERPTAVSCPPGATPNVAGSGSQGWTWSPSVNQGAVFDERAGRIVYVDGEGATWAFDVCTNTWEQRHASLPGFEEYAAGDLVYDVDSDRTVGLDLNSGVNVYDAATGTWTIDDALGDRAARGAVYDPVSGLVVVAHFGGDWPSDLFLSGYDVDTREWSELGTIENVWGDSWMFLVGYSSATDELILHGGYAPGPGDPLGTQYPGSGPTTVLHSLRNEMTAVLPGGPNLFSPWGAWYPYATGVEGAVLASDDTYDDDRLCRFDAVARSWDDCSLDAAYGPRRNPADAKMVYDPINDRLVVIYWLGDVWAVDLDTGQWTELVDRLP